MRGIGELLRLIAALAFVAYVAMTIYPPSSDPADIRFTLVGAFWTLSIASMFFRQSDDLPLLGFVACVSLVFVVAGNPTFKVQLLAAMTLCACAIFYDSAATRKFDKRSIYGWAAGLAIIPIAAKLIFDIYSPDNLVTVTPHWWGNSVNATLTDDATFFVLYIIFAIASMGFLHWQELIDELSAVIGKNT